MPKLQLRAGKLLRNAAGKIIRAVRCCCGQPPTPGCNRIGELKCGEEGGTGTNAPLTIKVTIAGTNNDTGDCTDSGAYHNLSGSINREYILNLIAGETDGWRGWFLTAERTDAAGAIDYDGCDDVGGGPFADGVPRKEYTITVSFDTEQRATVLINAEFGGGGGDWFLATQADVTDFCYDTNVIDNEAVIASGFLAEDGTATVEVCPPCAVECSGGATCANFVMSGCVNDAAQCVGPEPKFHFQYRTASWVMGGLLPPGTSGGSPAPPAGCIWVYKNSLPGAFVPDDDRRTLYLWFDGQDWQGILTKREGLLAETELLRTKFAGDISCVDGTLSGTITLESWSDFGTLGLCSGCTATVTLGTCDCFELTANFDSTDTVWFNGGAWFAPGDYVVTYLYGALTYSDGTHGPAQGYRVNADAIAHYTIVDDSESDIEEAPPQGEYTEEASEAAVTAANAGSTVTFTHAGGKIGIKVFDNPLDDNVLDGDGRAPRFKLCAA